MLFVRGPGLLEPLRGETEMRKVPIVGAVIWCATMTKIPTTAAVVAALATLAHAEAPQMPKTLIGRWCWESPVTPPSSPQAGTYHRCDMLGGGEDFEFKSHGMADEGTIGKDDWHLAKVTREPNVYLLEFVSGEHRNRARVSVNPILPGHVTITWEYINPNFGKADDYGSERYSVINQCMIAKAKSMDACMAKSGYVFCPDCQVFGNDGPRCKDDDPLHSWCWEQDIEKALKVNQ
jgi:hypothetical protein